MDIEVVEKLLADGVQIDFQDDNGSSALRCASQNGYSEVAQILLASGAQIDLQAEDGLCSNVNK